MNLQQCHEELESLYASRELLDRESDDYIRISGMIDDLEIRCGLLEEEENL